MFLRNIIVILDFHLQMKLLIHLNILVVVYQVITNLGGSGLNAFYKKYGQKLDNLTEILTNVYTEFIISLREYNNEMNDFVKYVSNLDMLLQKHM